MTSQFGCWLVLLGLLGASLSAHPRSHHLVFPRPCPHQAAGAPRGVLAVAEHTTFTTAPLVTEGCSSSPLALPRPPHGEDHGSQGSIDMLHLWG